MSAERNVEKKDSELTPEQLENAAGGTNTITTSGEDTTHHSPGTARARSGCVLEEIEVEKEVD